MVPETSKPLIFESFYWGLISAVSLNIGSIIGVTCLPGQKTRAVLMSFGGGALLFALSVELFANALQKSEERDDISLLWVMMISAIAGGAFFAFLNQALNTLGADVRKHSTTKSRFARLRSILMRRLAARLMNIPFFSVLSMEELKDLIQSAMYKVRFNIGDIIMSEEAGGKDIFFILSGEVRIKLLETEPLGSAMQPQANIEAIAQTAVPATKKRDNIVKVRASTFSEGDFGSHTVSPLSGGIMTMICSEEPDWAANPELTMHEWILGPNQIFGDMAVLAGTHFNIVAEAIAPTKVLVLPGHEVARLLEVNSAVRDLVSLHAVERLHEVAELKHLPEHALIKLATRCVLSRYQSGDEVFQGTVEEDTPILCLVLGSIELFWQGEGRKRTLRASHLFCMEHLTSGASGPALTATALEPATVLSIPRSDIANIIAHGGEINVGSDPTESGCLPGQMPTGINSAIREVDDFDDVDGGAQITRSPSQQMVRRSSSSSMEDMKSWISKKDQTTTVVRVLPPLRAGPVGLRGSIGGQGGEVWSHLGWDDTSELPLEDQAEADIKKLSKNATRPILQVTDAELAEHEAENKACKPVASTRRSSKISIRGVAALEDGAPGCGIRDGDLPFGSEQSGSEQQQFSKQHSNMDGSETGRAGGESSQKGGMNAAQKRAVMVWLGLLIDAVPESLVIGILVNNSSKMPGDDHARNAAAAALPFVIGVFISNLPESMSSSGSMKAHGMKVRTILLMWVATTLLTACGSALGAVLFPPTAAESGSIKELVVVGVEGLAAGAMLTMIAQTMMPEAFEQGGDIVGLSCLIGFLCAMSVKLLPLGGQAAH